MVERDRTQPSLTRGATLSKLMNWENDSSCPCFVYYQVIYLHLTVTYRQTNDSLDQRFPRPTLHQTNCQWWYVRPTVHQTNGFCQWWFVRPTLHQTNGSLDQLILLDCQIFFPKKKILSTGSLDQRFTRPTFGGGSLDQRFTRPTD